jgi:hypothetical protein
MYKLSIYLVAPKLWRWEIRSDAALLLCGTGRTKIAAEKDARDRWSRAKSPPPRT